MEDVLHCKGPVYCPVRLRGTKQQEIWIKRGGTGQMSGSGASGRKLRPAAKLARSLADMARAHKPRRG